MVLTSNFPFIWLVSCLVLYMDHQSLNSSFYISAASLLSSSPPLLVSTALLFSSPSLTMLRPSPEPIATSGVRAAAEAVVSPLERDPNSPKGWKKRESEGIGLGIVAALSNDGAARRVVNFRRAMSPPMPITPREASTARISCKWSDQGGQGRGWCWYVGSVDSRDREESEVSVRNTADYPRLPVAGFLSACYLCRKKLDGKDIYMYRGEKAFCSTECRHRQIVADEYQESCGHEASRLSDVSSSVYPGGRLFGAGVVAA